jgi:VCBS repeat-containing protein
MKAIEILTKLILNSSAKQKLTKEKNNYLLSVLALAALPSQIFADNTTPDQVEVKGYLIDFAKLAKEAGIDVSDIDGLVVALVDSSMGELIYLGNGIYQFIPSPGIFEISFAITNTDASESSLVSISLEGLIPLDGDTIAYSDFDVSDFQSSLISTPASVTLGIDMIGVGAAGVGLALAMIGDSSATASTTETIEGVISEGTLKDAQVFLDLDDDNVLDWTDGNSDGLWNAGEGEQWTLSAADGSYSLSGLSAADIASGTLIGQAYVVGGVSQTVDMISGSDVANIMMMADSSATVITPLTSLVKAGLSNADALDILGLDDSGIDINNFNPFSVENDGTANAVAFEKIATKLFTTVNSIAEAISTSAGTDMDATDGFIIAMREVSAIVIQEAEAREANEAIDVEAAELQAIADAEIGGATAEQIAAVSTKQAEKTTERDLDLSNSDTIASVATASITAADTQIKEVKVLEKIALQAEADDLAAIVEAAGEDVTAEQTAALSTKNDEITAKNTEATTDKVGDAVSSIVTSVSKAIVNVNTQIDTLTAFDATAKDTLKMGAETLATQVKAAAADNTATMTLSADTLTTLTEDDTSKEFTAVSGTATSLTGFYGNISNDGGGASWTYTLHTAGAHGQAQSTGESYIESFIITDGLGDPKTVTVVVYGKDDAAVITAADGTIAEGATTITDTATHTDVDAANSDNVFIAVSTATDSANGYGTYTVTSGGVWTYTLDNTNATVDALGDGEDTTDTITVTSEDGTTEAITITITGTNDAPVFTSSATASSPENGTAAAIITATDVESDAITYSISGTDSSLFSIVGSTGVLTFNTAPDYELTDPVALDNTYTLTVSASDGTVSVDQELTVTVTNVEGGPVFSSAETIAVNENQTAVLTLTASDDENDTIAFSISGGDDSASFSLTGGVLTFAASPNYEVKSSYSVTVTASETTDINGTSIESPNTTDQTITVSINDINDAAVITAADGTIAEGTASLAATATHADEDTGNNDNTFLAVSDIVATYGTYSVTSAGVLTYTLDNTNATVDALGDSENVTDTVTVTSEDGTTEAVTITITGTNDAAVISGTSVGAVTEDDSTTTATGTLTHTDVDTNNDANVFTAVSSATDSVNGYGTYTVTSGGVWTYTLDNTNTTVSALAASATTTDTFAITAEDGTSQTVTVTITGANDAPVAVADSVTISEDAAATIISVLGNDTDAEGTTLTTVSGKTNGSNGTVTNNGDGTVSYTPTANFSGTDTFQYKTNDGTVDSQLATVTVTVSAVNDDPTGSVTIAGTAKTGQTLTASNDLADVDGLGAISYQWAKDGADVSGATNATLVLDDDDLGSTLTVTASYTDDDGTAESAISSATGEVIDMVKLIQVRDITTMTASEASIALNGSDYSGGSTETVVAFDLYLDAEGLDTLNASATEIRGAQFSLGFTASDLASVATFATSEDASWIMEFDDVDGVFTVSTPNNATGSIALAKTTAVVDIDTTNDTGRNTVLLEQKMGTVYLNPAEGVDDIRVTLQSMIIPTDDANVEPLSYSVDVL